MQSHARQTKAVVVTLHERSEDRRRLEARNEELLSLVQTMGAVVAQSLVLPLRTINPSTLIGSGQVAELERIAKQTEANCIIFDHDLPPRCQRNLESTFDMAVIDRQEVILQIFSERAATREATLQVALARQQYSLPRLKRRWTHLSRQRGGAKGTKGEGEMQLEIDRRIVTKRITALKSELVKLEAQRLRQRKNRANGNIPVAAIVGYTNAGKSTLLNILSQSDVLVENKLFATLDPATRHVLLPHKGKLLITDTVGFVRDLPHQLVEAFKSTLEEVRFADFIIHVVDASHPDMLQCYQTTMEVLDSLECTGKPMVLFINKMDAVHDEFSVMRLLSEHPEAILGSLKDGSGIDTLCLAMERTAHASHAEHTYLIPHSRYDLVSLVRSYGTICSISYIDEGVRLRARVPERLVAKLKPFDSVGA